MVAKRQLLANALPRLGHEEGAVTVALSNELVQLLSDQLYQSPLKAIEELVVNAYDADAKECKLFVPSPTKIRAGRIVCYDNGSGMDLEGLTDLWQIGRSNKRTQEIERRSSRKQIGKFGIGKLATYTIAHRLTYVTRSGNRILSVSLDFREFTEGPTGAGKPIQLKVHQIDDWGKLEENPILQAACSAAGIDLEQLVDDHASTWTLAILEDIKPKAEKIRLGRLRWVLETAMPLVSGFRLFLNGEEIASSKAATEPIVNFGVSELPQRRLKALKDGTGEKWVIRNGRLFSESSFKEGIGGQAIVTGPSLHAGKSSDLGRSNGFFIRVRGRLVNEEDPLFGLKPLSYQTFNRFRADLDVDDLDGIITAPREGVEESGVKDKLEVVLSEIFYEARDRYEAWLKEQEEKEGRKREEDRNFVAPQLIEHPIADVLSTRSGAQQGAEADETWFYIEVDKTIDLKDLVRSLYVEPRHRYRYEYSGRGSSGRLVRFNPANSTFSINADHSFIIAHSDNPRAQVLLEDIVTAEALLEVYLREAGITPQRVGEVLERRDALLRGLAQDHPFSLQAIAAALRDASAHQYDLEVAMIAAARAVGFVATHVSGSGNPDGLARFTDYPDGEKKITLEAKSSEETPSLGALDIAGLAEHVEKTEADGCLLIAPSYPGGKRGQESAVSARARQNKISCWTIDQLAQFVAAAEARHLTARNILDIRSSGL